jgi:hypothetical protein
MYKTDFVLQLRVVRIRQCVVTLMHCVIDGALYFFQTCSCGEEVVRAYGCPNAGVIFSFAWNNSFSYCFRGGSYISLG